MEFRRIIANTGVRFSAKPVILSPQLEDIDHSDMIKKPVASDKVDYRIVLTVAGFKMDQVSITFRETDGKKFCVVRMKQWNKSELKGYSTGLLARDCCYVYEIPEKVDKETLLAQWTDDDFLVIQPRISQSFSQQSKSIRIIPVRVSRVLRPFLDSNILKEMMITIQTKLNMVRSFIHSHTMVEEDKDVLECRGGFPNVELGKIHEELKQMIKAWDDETERRGKEEKKLLKEKEEKKLLKEKEEKKLLKEKEKQKKATLQPSLPSRTPQRSTKPPKKN